MSKEKLLCALRAEINKLSKAYAAVESLPESFFENLINPNRLADMEVLPVAKIENKDPVSLREAVFNIIKDEGKPMSRREIEYRFVRIIPAEHREERSLTYALAGLKKAGVIDKFNSSGGRKGGRGFKWTLTEWTENQPLNSTT